MFGQQCWVRTLARSVPRDVRRCVRVFTFVSREKRIRTLHRLGSCYALPGIDYLRYEYLSTAFPQVASFESICKLCGRNIENPDNDSDVPFTSSSSDDQQQGETHSIRCDECHS